MKKKVNIHLDLLLRTSLIYVDIRQVVPARRKRLSVGLLLFDGVQSSGENMGEICKVDLEFWEERYPYL